jgi:Domain of unknown function (DUF4157)
VTDHDEAVVPLGRRLDALARARLRALAPRPAWASPLAVALRHTEEVADVLGERFERTEMPPRPPAEPAFDLADATIARRAVPGTWAGREGGNARQGPLADDGDAWPPAQERDDDTPDHEVREVPADVRSRLRREVGPAADLMRVHAGPEADVQARSADADAVTKGRDVYLRQGRWAPRREEGVALLAHEATHVAALVDPGTAWRRAVGELAEEALARARERALLGAGAGRFATGLGAGPGWPGPLDGPATRSGAAPGHGEPAPSVGHTSPPAPAAAPAAASAPPAVAVRSAGTRASVDRDLTPPAPAVDLDALRRAVIAEVMQRMRSEIERGA